jgi:hypothetical protein
MWTQIVGKIRMALSPPMNHFWNVALYVTTRGLTTSPIPYHDRTFEIRFDFIDHKLMILTSEGSVAMLPLKPRPVAAFYKELMSALERLGIKVSINPMPQEVPNPIPFDQDTTHASYAAEYAHRCWRILASVDQIFKEFRGRFVGKSSPVHFFWGSFDLAVTRFCGRRAPERPGADRVTREAYSQECSSAGWWPGGATPAGTLIDGPAFYSYMSPSPPGLDAAEVRPRGAHFDHNLGEFLLMYDDVRRARSPKAALMEFLQSTYEAGANLARWDRAALEMPASRPGKGGEHAA